MCEKTIHFNLNSILGVEGIQERVKNKNKADKFIFRATSDSMAIYPLSPTKLQQGKSIFSSFRQVQFLCVSLSAHSFQFNTFFFSTAEFKSVTMKNNTFNLRLRGTMDIFPHLFLLPQKSLVFPQFIVFPVVRENVRKGISSFILHTSVSSIIVESVSICPFSC